jgi:acyl-coenzyme A thioesterase PaaI-like protein
MSGTSATRVVMPTVDTMTERLETIPFIRAIGMHAIDLRPSQAVTRVVSRSGFRKPGKDEHLCEGLISAVVDQAASAAIWSAVGLQMPHATLSLSMTFLKRTTAEVLDYHAQVMGFSGGLGLTHVRVVDPQARDLIAHGMVNYVIGTYPGDSQASEITVVPDPSMLDGEPIQNIVGTDIETALGLVDAGQGFDLGYNANLVGSRGPVALHGGVLVLGQVAAARRQLGDHSRLNLSHLSIDYLRSGLQQSSHFEAVEIARSRKTLSVRMEGTQDQRQRHMVTGTARFFAPSDQN